MAHRIIWWMVVCGGFGWLLWDWASLPYADLGFLIILAVVDSLLLPVMVVLRWNWRGVFVGSVFVCCSLLAVRRVGTGLDPYFRGEDGPAYAAIVCSNRIIGVVYGLLILGVKRLMVGK
jgi:hypothetical protein